MQIRAVAMGVDPRTVTFWANVDPKSCKLVLGRSMDFVNHHFSCSCDCSLNYPITSCNSVV